MMQRQWTTFATSGAPLASWPQYDESRRATMVFDEISRVVDDPEREKRIAWEGYDGYRGQSL
ncbi:hypothetical protein DW322_21095 [Rhodococcus rhodnii]|nr:hypothetical protein [Rhodococcus rhodnii]TXG92203.1 hypothetical protein DW322_21095 [Rhodococcus rhodnii]